MKALKKIQYDNVKPVANGATADVGISRDQSPENLNGKSQSHRIWVRVIRIEATASARPELEMRPRLDSPVEQISSFMSLCSVEPENTRGQNSHSVLKRLRLVETDHKIWITASAIFGSMHTGYGTQSTHQGRS